MEPEEIGYVFRYYGHLMTMQERAAYKHLVTTAKEMHGRTDLAAQTELLNRPLPHHLRTKLSDNPKILHLTKEGLEAFIDKTGQRILDDHRNKILFNFCCRCGRLARTPKARQCRFCGHDWHRLREG